MSKSHFIEVTAMLPRECGRCGRTIPVRTVCWRQRQDDGSRVWFHHKGFGEASEVASHMACRTKE